MVALQALPRDLYLAYIPPFFPFTIVRPFFKAVFQAIVIVCSFVIEANSFRAFTKRRFFEEYSLTEGYSLLLRTRPFFFFFPFVTVLTRLQPQFCRFFTPCQDQLL